MSVLIVLRVEIIQNERVGCSGGTVAAYLLSISFLDISLNPSMQFLDA